MRRLLKLHGTTQASPGLRLDGTAVASPDFTRLCEEISHEFPNAIFFTSKLIFATDNWFTRLLHNQAALAVQRRLHLEGLQMVILPMKV